MSMTRLRKRFGDAWMRNVDDDRYAAEMLKDQRDHDAFEFSEPRESNEKTTTFEAAIEKYERKAVEREIATMDREIASAEREMAEESKDFAADYEIRKIVKGRIAASRFATVQQHRKVEDQLVKSAVLRLQTGESPAIAAKSTCDNAGF